MKMKFNLKKHLMKHKRFGSGLGYLNLPHNIEELLIDGIVQKENLKELVSILYIENINLIKNKEKVEKNLEDLNLMSGTNLYSDIYTNFKNIEYKIKRITKAIKKIERYYL